MAKPTKYATLICFIMTIIALAGIIVGILLSKPLIIAACLFPTIAYEAYRTEGESTRWASWVLLLVIILEIIFIIANVSFDIGNFLGQSEREIAGFVVPLGDIKILGPIVMAILSIILFVRTRGKYTKWLAAIIFVTCFALVWTLNPDIFKNLLKIGVENGLENLT
ncbi:MAG: hypothetical protein ACYCXK_09015 [Candidatus Humimicrobiaceae bacterium]